MSVWGLRSGMRVFAAAVGAGVLGTVAAGVGRAADPEPAAIDAIFSEWNAQTPGVALAVVRDEKVIYSRGYGLANLDHSVPVATNTVFDIGSTSKQFTAACILLLAEEGKLAITDEVRKHIPEFPQYEKPITIAHLLHHTSGLRDYTALLGLSGRSLEHDYSQAFLVDLICRQKGLNFTPGERFAYTNTGYFLLGEIVRRVAGMPMSRFARARIFEPLGMTSTIFMDDHQAVIPHRAESYYPREDGGAGFVLSVSLMDCVGDGGIYTTVEDLARWDANFYHNKIGAGKPEFLDRMQEVGLLNDGKSTGYASGLFIGEHRGRRTVSHSGGWCGFRSEMVRFPDQKLTVICLSNIGTAQPSAWARRIADFYLEGKGEDAATPPTPSAAAPSGAATFAMPEADWGRFVGRYRADSGPTWTVTRYNNTLSISSTSGLAFSARPIGALEFESTDRPALARLTFSADSAGKIVSITQSMTDTPDVRLTRLGEVTNSSEGLADFQGTYSSEELGSTMKATVTDGRLHFTNSEDADPYPLNRFAADGFFVWGYDALFTRGEGGKVDGFVMNSPSASGLRFVKRGG